MIDASQNHVGFWAALAHRLSGVALAVFLPLHFLTLGLALQSEARLDATLRWFEQPWLRAGEWALVCMLTLHLVLGLRVLALEFVSWRNGRKGWIGLAALAAALAGVAFAVVRG
jgi:fumarate reductase subunit D